MSETSKPRVFRLEPDAKRTSEPKDEPTRRAPRTITVTEEPDAFAAEAAAATPDVLLKPQESRFSVWTRLFWSALTGLLTLALGLWFWRLVDELYRTNVYVGWLGVGLLGIAAVALLALVLREVHGLRSLSAATEMRDAAEAAARTDDGDGAKAVVRRLLAYQASDPSTAQQRGAMEGYLGEIIDGRGLLTLADRTLMLPRDELAKAVIASAAKRVSVVTAISPRAIVDIMFVAAQSVMLTRRIADIYGARPGTLGFFRLGRRILGHLAITGGVAISDSVLSQLVGHGLAARLSAKLGEGVLNGLLTARVGLAAVAACRPLPFLAAEEPKLQDVAGEILSNPLGKKD
jgi:putative membrane protein